MAKVDELKVALRNSLIVEQRESSEIVLEAGTLVKVAEISDKNAWFTNPESGGTLSSHKTRYIKFYGPNKNCLSIGWSDVVPPKECTLIISPPFIYCATNDNFVHIEITEDSSHCPLCGKDLRDEGTTKKLLERLKNLSLTTHDVYNAVATIMVSIELGKTTWEELGTTLDECEEFARLNHVKHLRVGIEALQDETLNSILKKNIVENIKAKVANGTTSWEELGISEDGLHELIQ